MGYPNQRLILISFRSDSQRGHFRPHALLHLHEDEKGHVRPVGYAHRVLQVRFSCPKILSRGFQVSQRSYSLGY